MADRIEELKAYLLRRWGKPLLEDKIDYCPECGGYVDDWACCTNDITHKIPEDVQRRLRLEMEREERMNEAKEQEELAVAQLLAEQIDNDYLLDRMDEADREDSLCSNDEEW